MLTFLSKIIKFNTILALGVFRTGETDILYSLTLKKRKDKLEILSSFTYTNVDDFLKNPFSKLPVLLLVDGKGVLNKKVDLKNEQDIAWKKNIDFSVIYYNEYRVNEVDYISFSRKNPVEELIAKLSAKNVQIIDVYIGPLASALTQTAINKDIIIANDTVLRFDNAELTEISKDLDLQHIEYFFGNDRVSKNHLPLYGAAIHFFLQQKEYFKSSIKSIDQEAIIYKRAFNYFGAGMLIVFFISLLVSYTSIQYYLSKNIELNQQTVYSNQTYKHILELEAQKEQKLKILNDTGQLSKNFLSYYVYKLMESVPAAVELNGLDVFPLSKEVKENEKITINSNFIFLKGSTSSEYAFNSWLSRLKNIKWIKKFEILSLKKDKKNIEQFEIKILIDDF